MAVQWLEDSSLAESEQKQSASNTEATRVFFCQTTESTDDAGDVRDFVEGEVASTFADLPLSSVEAEERDPTSPQDGVCAYWTVTVTYSRENAGGGSGGGGGSTTPEPNTSEFSFAFRSPGGKVYYNYRDNDDVGQEARTARFLLFQAPNGGAVPGQYDAATYNAKFKGLIGVDEEGKHVGVDLPAPVVNFGPLTVYVPRASITGSYLKTIADLIARGAVNDAPVTVEGQLFEKGELRMVEVTGQPRSDDDYAVSFGMHYIPNVAQGDSFQLGPWQCTRLAAGRPTKYGHELLWTHSHEVEVAGDDGEPTLAIRDAFLEQIYDYVDFTDFSLI